MNELSFIEHICKVWFPADKTLTQRSKDISLIVATNLTEQVLLYDTDSFHYYYRTCDPMLIDSCDTSWFSVFQDLFFFLVRDISVLSQDTQQPFVPLSFFF